MQRGDDIKTVSATPQGSGSARFIPPEILAGIGSLELLARTVVEGFISGLHRSPFPGFSTEFAEYRQYMAGDDLRHLDWRLLGRTDRYYIKKYRGDTNTQCHILVDVSASMRYGSGALTKLQYAQFAAASIAYLASRQQDAVGLIAFDEKIKTHIPAHNRSGHMRTIFGNIAQLTAENPTRLSNMIHLAADRISRRSIVILISDMYDDREAVINALQHLRFKGNDVIIFHILDPNEVKFNFSEPVLLEDTETAEQMHVLPEILAEGYRKAIQQHITGLREGALANRIDYEMLTTDQPLDFAMFSFFSRRAKL